MLRITRSQAFDMVSQMLARQQARLGVIQERAVTGLLVNRASDAPERLGEIHALRAAVADQERWGESAGQAEDLLVAADSALAGAADTLTQLRELAVAMASETYTADDRAAQVEAVTALRDTFLAAANTEFGGRYLFAGSAWDTAPFDAAGTYLGDAETPRLGVGASLAVDVGLPGSEVFQSAVDAFAVFDDLAAALAANDTAAITASLDAIDAAADAIAGARSHLGTHAGLAADAITTTSSMAELLQARLDAREGADPATTYLELAELQTAYETTLQVAAQLGTDNLFSKL